MERQAEGLYQALFQHAGDTIVLEAGCRYVGGLTLPPRPAIVTLRSGGSLPTRRVGPMDAPGMAVLINAAGPVINGTGAANWIIDGIAFEGNTTGEVITVRSSELQVQTSLPVLGS